MLTDNEIIKELQSASEWFKEHGRNTNTAIVGICDRAVDLINQLKAENTELQRKNAELKIELKAIKAEIERLECSIISQDEEKLSYVAMLIKEEQERIQLEQIRRLEAEISELQEELAKKSNKLCEILPIVAELKNEAIKEFAERLQGCYDDYDDYDSIYVHRIRDDIDFLVKMTEDEGK